MTLKMTTAQVVETSVTVTNSSFQNYTHPDDHTTQTTDTPGYDTLSVLWEFWLGHSIFYLHPPKDAGVSNQTKPHNWTGKRPGCYYVNKTSIQISLFRYTTFQTL